MSLSYEDAFRGTDRLNPVSDTVLFQAGKLSKLSPETTILELGCGKGLPSLLWAGAFGARVEGFDQSGSFVEFAEARAGTLGLSERVKFTCGDVREAVPEKKYDAVACLGLGLAHVFGGFEKGLEWVTGHLRDGGFFILSEPVWRKRPVPPELLQKLGTEESQFATDAEMRGFLQKAGLRVQTCFTSSKEDWELYVRPVQAALHEIAGSRAELAEEARAMADGFQAECDAAGTCWDLTLWVARAG